MAKNSMKAREDKRIKLVEKYKNRRAKVKATISGTTDYNQLFEAQFELQKMPRDSSSIRVYRRCQCCGRPRAVYRKFGLCRICLREVLVRGDVPGGKKASW